MKKTTTLEEMHFSGRDGPDMTMRILEKRPGYDPEATHHTLEFDHGARIGLPLGTSKMARYIGEAIIRTADRMDQQPRAGGKYPMFGRLDLADAVRVRSGLRLRPVYEHTTVTGLGSTGAHILGVDWLNEDDEVTRFEPMNRQHTHGSGGTAACFTQEEIGLPLTEVIRRRKEAGQDVERIAIFSGHREFTTIVARYVDPGARPETIAPPYGEIISEIVHGVPKDADDGEIMIAIRTFFALPKVRRDRVWREAFTEALYNHFQRPAAEIANLIARAKAG